MLELRDLSFSYPGVNVLRAVGFTLPRPELVALFGPNGSGKTTIFRCILRSLRYSGSVYLDGQDTSRLSARDVARRVAYVPQEHDPPFPYRVLDMVLMGRTPHLRGVFGPTEQDRRIAFDALMQVGIEELADRAYTRLSGGQRQLVLLARALNQDAGMLLLDEPAASLDFGNQLLLWNTIRGLSRSGRTVLICTHDPNHVLWFCDRVIVLGRAGTVVADGNPRHTITPELVRDVYGAECTISSVYGRDVAVPPVNPA